VLSYDGGAYHGWQRQENAVTIQQVLEEKIGLMTGEKIRLIASGRTDAGVHALNQVCNFQTRSRIEPDSLRRGLNSLISGDIHVKTAETVPLDFHSRYDARSKVYEYRILNRAEPELFLRHYTWHVRHPLDREVMDGCLAELYGTHDFSAFRSSGSSNRNPVRRMIRADIQGPENGLLVFRFEADGFLRHMVRNVVGTVVETGMEKRGLQEFREILHSRDRCRAGIKAPPQGLFLVEVKY
jgi:tRNA pseudouridine38-40 synthase